MLIDPSGLLQGERIGACSDEAQLHFPRLMAATNGFGRIEMSYGNIIRTVYAQFATKPTKKAMLAWFLEYHEHFLLFSYQAESGAQWGQWDVPGKMLPRFKKAADNQSPAPPEAEFKAFLTAKTEARKNNYMTPAEDFIRLPISEHFGNNKQISEIPRLFPNTSEITSKFQHGIGIGIGIGEVQIHEPLAPACADAPERVLDLGDEYAQATQTPTLTGVKSRQLTNQDVELIRLAYPHRVAPVPARKAIRAQHALLVKGAVTTAAGVIFPKMASPDATAYLLERTRLYADSPKGRSKQFIPNPATWFNGGRYTEDESIWDESSTSPIRQVPQIKYSDPEAMNAR